jgi:hypothetical protein
VRGKHGTLRKRGCRSFASTCVHKRVSPCGGQPKPSPSPQKESSHLAVAVGIELLHHIVFELLPVHRDVALVGQDLGTTMRSENKKKKKLHDKSHVARTCRAMKPVPTTMAAALPIFLLA